MEGKTHKTDEQTDTHTQDREGHSKRETDRGSGGETGGRGVETQKRDSEPQREIGRGMQRGYASL